MPRTLVLALGLVVAGCSAPVALLPDAGPAAPPEEAPAVSLAPLAPTPQPDLPAPLRATGLSAVPAVGGHGAHPPPATSAAAPAGPARSGHGGTASPLAAALDAYLAVQEALALDDLAPVPAQARTLAGAWALATDDAPASDPHLWHTRAEGVAAVRAHALALAEAAHLDDAREAFGHLSGAFVPLVEAHGAPDGYDLSRFTCGMRRDLPDGGVWLQSGAGPRNPYYGAAMLTCATGGPAVPTAAGHDGHDR